MNNTINIGNRIIFKDKIASIAVFKTRESSLFDYVAPKKHKKFNFKKFCYETVVSVGYFKSIFGRNITFDDIRNRGNTLSYNEHYYLGNNGTHPVVMCKPKLTIFMVGDDVAFKTFFDTDEELDNFMETEFKK